jgi:penicillin-insensitive murein endopeptidase
MARHRLLPVLAVAAVLLSAPVGLAQEPSAGAPVQTADSAAAAAFHDWHTVAHPVRQTPQVIGTYTNGCVAGAMALPPDGAGYQVVRLSRNRYWGHPDLIAFLEDYGRAVEAAGIGADGTGILAVGDLSQPRGGPMPSGHASHESGLDADIWLRTDLPRLPFLEREGLDDVSLVEDWRVTDAFTDETATLIRIAAADPRVERIFVHPAIKQAMCQRTWPDRSFLGTLRPWFGHTGHMHIRIGCPAGSPDCTRQAPPPPGEGCGAELASWFPDPDRPPAPPAPDTARPPPPPLPDRCLALLAVE